MKRIYLLSLALVCLITACVPYIYGVPQETWDRMSEPERARTIQMYEREQQARRQAAEERARQQAIEAQARRQAEEARARHEAMEREREKTRQMAREREMRERIEAIHHGRGAYGELIRVRLQGGRVRIDGQYHRIEPLTFTIADGETRRFSVADFQGRIVELTTTYANGAFAIEGVRFPYDRSWERGRLYTRTGIPGVRELRDLDVFIEIHDRSSRFERDQHRIMVIRELPPPVQPHVQPHVQPQIQPYVQPPVQRPTPPPVVDLPPRSVEVLILSGELRGRGPKMRIERTSIRIADGESRELRVKAGGESGVVMMRYSNGMLLIDGTPGRGHDTAQFRFEREWRTGKLYLLDLRGGPIERLELKVTGLGY